MVLFIPSAIDMNLLIPQAYTLIESMLFYKNRLCI